MKTSLLLMIKRSGLINLSLLPKLVDDNIVLVVCPNEILLKIILKQTIKKIVDVFIFLFLIYNDYKQKPRNNGNIALNKRLNITNNSQNRKYF